MADVASAIVGIIGAVVGAASSTGLAYFFWKHQHAIEADLAEVRSRREMRLAITDRVRDIVAELLLAARGVAANPGFARERQIMLLKSLQEPIKRFFSERVSIAFDATIQREPQGQLESDARMLLPLMYDESLK